MENNPAKDFFLNANPNPTRNGCPDEEVLRAIANNTLPETDPARLHLASCSPCFSQFNAYKESAAATNDLRKRKLLTWAAAAALVLAVGLTLILTRHPKENAPSLEIATNYVAPEKLKRATPQKVATIVRLDFQNLVARRGTSGGMLPTIWHIPQTLVTLEITLPFGSDDGLYTVELRTTKDEPLLKTVTAKAEILNGETRLIIPRLDLAEITPGKYALAFRHADAHWTKARLSIP